MNLRHLAFGFATILAPLSAHAAANLVTNGSFESATPTATGGSGNFQFSAGSNNFNGGTVTGWASPTSAQYTNPFNLLFKSNNVAASNAASPSQPANYAANQYNDNRNYLAAYNGPSPDGGNFVALDGDPNVSGPIQQTINNLSVGGNYLLTFYWAATQMASATGAITEQLQATFGAVSQLTSVVSEPSDTASAWMTQTFLFKATSASQVLSFLSIGTPAGNPPLALLDGVSLVAAPEPTTWALVIVGLGGVALLSRRRRRGTGVMTA